MRKLSQAAPLLILFAVALTVGVAVWWEARTAHRADAEPARQRAESDPAPPLIDRNLLSDAGAFLANEFTGAIHDPESLQNLREAIQVRGPRGLAELRAQRDKHRLRSSAGLQDFEACQLEYNIGKLLLYEGLFEDAAAGFQALTQAAAMPARFRSELKALLGLVALRRGEVANCIACVGPSSCIFPIVPEAVHTNRAGSREAIQHFSAYLEEVPGDLRVRWLLNIAYMTLGEYPANVPPRYLIPLDRFRSKIDVGQFENVALLVGLAARGPNLAGGSVFDDFTGDGLPDIFATSLDFDKGASLYVNRGDGTFEDRSYAAGLSDQIYALNVSAADFDNDGDLDVVLLRGGWEKPMRLSLLRNDGQGTFEDVTVRSGLSLPIATEAAAWGDYDNDGFVDLFVCGEYLPPTSDRTSVVPDPRNRCRLYRNQGDGTFRDVAATAGVVNEDCAKGSAWGDYDGDGWLDLYVSNMFGPARLYQNLGDGTFRDVARELKVTGPEVGFACWFWDFDNDGQLDLYVNDYKSRLAEIVAVALGIRVEGMGRPRLYRNLGPEGFRDIAREAGLDLPMTPMGCNFGDIDNDGYLDFYLGTGRMALEDLVPNRLFKNVEGRRFEDITMSSGTGHLQKGHGVSFADWDADGDLDLFIVVGGAVPGDRAYNVLFQNPGQSNHALKVKLVGTTTNRGALGARIKAVVKGPDGTTRCIYRTVGNNSSFGGNSLVQMIGLREAASVAELEVFWPTSRTTQTFRDVQADQMIEITEGKESFKVVPQRRLTVPSDEPVHRPATG